MDHNIRRQIFLPLLLSNPRRPLAQIDPLVADYPGCLYSCLCAIHVQHLYCLSLYGHRNTMLVPWHIFPNGD